MRELIIEKLKEIEQTEHVCILHAVESGSRAWGFPSKDSDYDVRFIYMRPMEHYLRLERTRDVIELPINKILDINGWDISKTLQLLHASNPTLFEWISSPIVYHKTDFVDRFKPLFLTYFTSRKGLYHYISMAEGNFCGYLKGDMVKAKKYFYVLRPVLACLWILEHGTPPPMLFGDLVESQLSPTIRPEVDRLLELKMHSPEVKEIPIVRSINDYLERTIAEVKERVATVEQTANSGWEPLNELFRELVMK